MSCNVCIEKFNKSDRARVSCPWCNYDVCRDCTKTYIFTLTSDPHCMNCKREWSRENISTFFSKKFMTQDYKEFRENILFEREKALMPATQPLVEKTLKIRAATAQRDAFEKERLKLMKDIEAISTMSSIDFCAKYNHTFTTIGNLRLAKSDILRPLNLENARVSMESSIMEQRIAILNGMAVDGERRAFVRACPATGCRGFLSSAWKCGICDVWACSKCHEIKGDERDAPHVCNPDNIATAELLAKDSRPCPTCAALIFKIDGCDQMWCSQCKTAFSWRTGRPETGRIHNPHYYEYMRARGDLPREEGDIPCGGLPAIRALITALMSRKVDQAKLRQVETIHRIHGHIEYVVIPRFQVNRYESNNDLRVAYMMKEISTEYFKTIIQKREKALQKKMEIVGVLRTYNAITAELMAGLSNVDKFLTEMAGLVDFTNAAFAKVSSQYNCVCPLINKDNFVII